MNNNANIGAKTIRNETAEDLAERGLNADCLRMLQQARKRENPGKRALEEGENEDGNPTKFRQLEEEPEPGDMIGEQDEEEMEIGGISGHGNAQYRDDLSGKPLIPELVNKARLEEMGEIAKHGVYEKYQ